jgi:hypothetical protein
VFIRSAGLTLAAFAAMFAGTGEAGACLSVYHDAWIHNALPTPLPRDMIVADVVLERLPPALESPQGTSRWPWGILTYGVRARVRRMIQGDPAIRELLLRPVHISSCDSFFANGEEGLIVAAVRRSDHGIVVVHPVGASSRNGYRLPDGEQVEEHLRRAIAAVDAREAAERKGARGPAGSSGWAVAHLDPRLAALALAAAMAAGLALLLMRRRRDR